MVEGEELVYLVSDLDYSPLLSELISQLQVANLILAGLCCFLGVIAGLLLIRILLDRM